MKLVLHCTAKHYYVDAFLYKLTYYLLIIIAVIILCIPLASCYLRIATLSKTDILWIFWLCFSWVCFHF